MIADIPTTATNRVKRSIRLANAKLRGTHSDQQWAALKEYCGMACVQCGEHCAPEKDHITPIYQGGCDCIHNIQPLCSRCNRSKGPDGTDHRPQGWQEHVLRALP